MDGKEGIFALLDAECKVNGTDAAFLEKLNGTKGKEKPFAKSRFDAKSKFGIRHYAGTVEYTAHDFLAKNRDAVPDLFLALMQVQQDVSE